jgi:hypothetical protein
LGSDYRLVRHNIKIGFKEILSECMTWTIFSPGLGGGDCREFLYTRNTSMEIFLYGAITYVNGAISTESFQARSSVSLYINLAFRQSLRLAATICLLQSPIGFPSVTLDNTNSIFIQAYLLRPGF